MTPQPIADYMASLFAHWPEEVRLLDPGAGIGSLTDAFSERFLRQAPPDSSLNVDCYEIEPQLTTYLRNHLEEIRLRLSRHSHTFNAHIHQRDFIEEASFLALMGGQRYTHAILNLWWADLFTMMEHQKRIAARRHEDKKAIYFGPSAFKPIATFPDEIRSANFKKLTAKLTETPLKLV